MGLSDMWGLGGASVFGGGAGGKCVGGGGELTVPRVGRHECYGASGAWVFRGVRRWWMTLTPQP